MKYRVYEAAFLIQKLSWFGSNVSRCEKVESLPLNDLAKRKLRRISYGFDK